MLLQDRVFENLPGSQAVHDRNFYECHFFSVEMLDGQQFTAIFGVIHVLDIVDGTVVNVIEGTRGDVVYKVNEDT